MPSALNSRTSTKRLRELKSLLSQHGEDIGEFGVFWADSLIKRNANLDSCPPWYIISEFQIALNDLRVGRCWGSNSKLVGRSDQSIYENISLAFPDIVEVIFSDTFEKEPVLTLFEKLRSM